MDRQYDQLSLEDRCAVATLRAEGRSIRQIASALDRAPSTISRELKRNNGRQVGYKPAYAQAQTTARRWSGMRLDRDAGLREQVLQGLARGWSPEQVCGALARQHGEAPRITAGGTICRAARANEACAVAKAAHRRSISRAACRSRCGRTRCRIAPSRAIGRPI
jgi:IS30 family transposase